MLPRGLVVSMLEEPSRGSIGTGRGPLPLSGWASSSEASSATAPVAISEFENSPLVKRSRAACLSPEGFVPPDTPLSVGRASQTLTEDLATADRTLETSAAELSFRNSSRRNEPDLDPSSPLNIHG